MKAQYLQEPELEFGDGKHVDIRFGLMNYGPFDRDKGTAPHVIKLGVVGTTQTIEGVLGWLERCKGGIDAKESRQPNLFPRFPGFGADSCFASEVVCETRCQRAIAGKEIELLSLASNDKHIVKQAASIFLAELDYLVNNASVDVLVCAIPKQLVEALDAEREPRTEDEDKDSEDAEQDGLKLDFHHLLKSLAMPLGKPIQIVLPTTYGEQMTRRLKTRPHKEKARALQDEATRAWNFHTAMYYKAGGVPWRLIRDPSQLTTCYIGISFYKSLDESTVMTSIAQVFDERGDGVIIRGGQAQLSKEDRQPHLSAEDAQKLMSDSLTRYRQEHRTRPARVVIHKSSKYSEGEREGFLTAIQAESVEVSDFVDMSRSFIRLYRCGPYPPLRGSFLSLDDRTHLLYTRGSVDFYETYPGKYVPRPLLFRCEKGEQTPLFLAKEILALTKMNWNATQFDHSEPITLGAARQVGAILKYIKQGDIHPRYSFYM